jgi:hypothetical protein
MDPVYKCTVYPHPQLTTVSRIESQSPDLPRTPRSHHILSRPLTSPHKQRTSSPTTNRKRSRAQTGNSDSEVEIVQEFIHSPAQSRPRWTGDAAEERTGYRMKSDDRMRNKRRDAPVDGE